MNLKQLNNMIKTFIPTHCPACSEPLSIDRGKKEDVIKLVCTNPNCIGTQLKRLQKGIVALEIRGIGPSTIEKLLTAGITISYDLFDSTKFSESILISSGEFQKGRALTKLIDAVKSTTEIQINKAILSLQIENIGKTFSEKIGQKLSGLDADFSSLMLDIREKLDDKYSLLNKEILDAIQKFEEFGVEIVRYEIPKKIDPNKIKKINKVISFTGFKSEEEESFKNIVEDKLEWSVEQTDYQLLIVPDKKKLSNDDVENAKTNNIKIMTWKQVKLVFL